MADAVAETMAVEEDFQTVPAQIPDPLEDSEGPRCQKCDTPVEADQMVLKHLTKGPRNKVLCKSCRAVQTMMARSFDGMPAGWDTLSHEESVNFYKAMLEKKGDGPLRFQLLRAEMKACLVHRHMEETKRGFNGEFHPLGYWQQRGYDVTKIEALAESMEHPVLGRTYRVDIFHVSTDTIFQKVEEALQLVDKAAKRKRIPKAKAKSNKRNKGNEPEEPAEEVEVVGGKGLTEKQLAALKKREAAKAAKKASAEAAKNTKVATTLASKALTCLQPVLDRMQKAKKGLKEGDADAATLEQMEEKLSLAETVVSQAQDILKKVGSGKTVALSEIEITSDKALAAEIKSMNNVIKSINLADLANGFSALYQYDKEQRGYVANFELENLKETCVWLVDFYTESWSKAELLSKAILCLACLRCHFEFDVALDEEAYSGYVKFGDPPGRSVQQKIAAYSQAHGRCVALKRSEVSQCVGYLGTVQQFFRVHENKAFFDALWPVQQLLSEVRAHL
ncbi:Uncharacterized protein SCF082_LOCUS385 [Durusdinium trenchii]|uniref:Uncharacterized protein n=1 Tax=Durusdinium trenchii TaxID=1381693 RepID=A0ABP0H945_9DINO